MVLTAVTCSRKLKDQIFQLCFVSLYPLQARPVGHWGGRDEPSNKHKCWSNEWILCNQPLAK